MRMLGFGAVLMLSITTCGVPPVPPTPLPATKQLEGQIVDAQHTPMAGVGVTVRPDLCPAPDQTTTAIDGTFFVALPRSCTGGYMVEACLSGVCSTSRFDGNASVGSILSAPLPLSDGTTTPPQIPVVLFSPLPALVAEGTHFRGVDGSRFTAIEASDFNLLNRWQHGEDITPILQQRQSAGFNMLRVWTLYEPSTIGFDFEDIDYSRVPAFVQLLARYGLYVEFTAYVEPQLENPAHLAQLVAAIQSDPKDTNVLIELMNEQDQHPIDLSPFTSPPAGLLVSHGSNGSQAIPVQPFWSYATYHTNGAFEWWRKTGHDAWEVSSGPVIANENTRAPDNFNSTQEAYDAAAGAALMAAGSCFHSVDGIRSQLWDATELPLAQAWAKGAKSVPLTCQDGAYTHRTDLEDADPTALRVYQRGSAPACVVAIHCGAPDDPPTNCR